MDKAISTFFSQHLVKAISFLAMIFTFLSEFGIVVILFCIGLCVYSYIKEKKIPLTFSFGLLFFGVCWLLIDGAGVLPFSIKQLVGRVRPYHVIGGFEEMMDSIHYRHPSSYSFPSGHTYIAFYLATVVFLRWKKVGYISFPLAVLVGFSRIYLGAHYFSDVLVGALLGVVLAICNYFLVKVIYKKLEEKGKADKLCV